MQKLHVHVEISNNIYDVVNENLQLLVVCGSEQCSTSTSGCKLVIDVINLILNGVHLQ